VYNFPGELCRSRSGARSNLAFSSLERIEKRSQALLEKKRIPSFFDKKKDSQQVVDLVDELQTAIVYYQVSGHYVVKISGVNKSGTDIATTIDIQ